MSPRLPGVMGHLLLPDFLVPQNTSASPESVKLRPRDWHFSLIEGDAKPCPAVFTTAALHAGLVQKRVCSIAVSQEVPGSWGTDAVRAPQPPLCMNKLLEHPRNPSSRSELAMLGPAMPSDPFGGARAH